MALYSFGSHFTFENIPRGSPVASVSGSSVSPNINPYNFGTSQTSHVESGRIENTWEKHRVESSDIEEFEMPGFHYLDQAMKNYWSDIRVPTRDSYRFIRARIAGMRASINIWIDDLKHGRVKLPVISISRTGHSYNPMKFTPAYGALSKRYVNQSMSRVALYYRPVPYNVDYTLSIWGEHKRDVEYILYRVLHRFNPLAELRVSDGHTIGNVQMLKSSSSDNSEKESSSEQHAKIRYDISYTAEAWLSIPEKIVPTILGNVVSFENRGDRISDFY